MTTTVSLLVVGYRSTEALPELLDSFREASARAGVKSEVVHVEHSGGEAPPAGVSVEHWVVQPNRGYAAGINRAAAAATGSVLLAANPDLRFRRDSLTAMLAALEGGWDIVGPRFELEGALFPPAERHTPRAELGRALAARSRRASARLLARRLEEAGALWAADARPVPGRFLSGALLAVTREAWEKLGAWDEDYFLYFEETDWLWRAARRGLRVAQVPAAGVEHRWGGAGGAAAAETRYATSRDRYYRKNFGPAGAFALRLARRPLPLAPSAVASPSDDDWWLVSPSSGGWPAARIPVAAGEAPVEAAGRLASALGRPTPLFLWSWNPKQGLVSSVRRLDPATGG